MAEYYKVLQVSRTATMMEIKAAYRKLALVFHPDVNGNDKAKSAQFRLIATAYEILSDENKRAQYDRSLPGLSRRVNAPRAYRPSPTAYQQPSPQRPGGGGGGSSGSSTNANFNVDEWNAWHYGDKSNREESVKRRNSWMDLVNSKHKSYFDRKAARERRKMEEESMKAEAEAGPKMTADEALRRKREERRRQQVDITNRSNEQQERSCVLT